MKQSKAFSMGQRRGVWFYKIKDIRQLACWDEGPCVARLVNLPGHQFRKAVKVTDGSAVFVAFLWGMLKQNCCLDWDQIVVGTGNLDEFGPLLLYPIVTRLENRFREFLRILERQLSNLLIYVDILLIPCDFHINVSKLRVAPRGHFLFQPPGNVGNVGSDVEGDPGDPSWCKGLAQELRIQPGWSLPEDLVSMTILIHTVSECCDKNW